MTNEVEDQSRSISQKVILGEQDLTNLGPGCFVKVKNEQGSFWVEIVTMLEETIVGTIHFELCESNYRASQPMLKTIHFQKNQIVDLGCDNYCFC